MAKTGEVTIGVSVDTRKAFRAIADIEEALKRVERCVRSSRVQELEQAIAWALNNVRYAAPEAWGHHAEQSFSHLYRILNKNEPSDAQTSSAPTDKE